VATTEAAAQVGPNTSVGQFSLIREIARGGMGQVYLARDTKLGRKVAIKFLLEKDPAFVARFQIEARATARCTHENIVTIHDVGEHAGLPFMVLEYLEGKTVSQLLADKPPLRTFVELMVPVVRALERAHEHGIVHRDLKPSNILVTERGTVKVLDFGVAKCFDTPLETPNPEAKPPRADSEVDFAKAVTYLTFGANGWIVGTLPYMSPEQWGAAEVDAATDIWAVGIIFWQAITGVHPAGTNAAEKLRERLLDLETPLPSLATKDPSLPKAFVAIVDRCLAKKKAERYTSASELLADLQTFLMPRARSASENDSPYVGLAAFGESDAKYFFGRSGEIRTALAKLEDWPLLAVIGPTGVGKSSFVHAGLLPALRSRDRWDVRVLRPGRAPLQALANVLELDTGVVDNLAEAPGQLGEALRRRAARESQRLLIVVDQLEELFTLTDDDAVRTAFLAALLAAADDPSAPVRVVLSMRADFLDRLANDKHFLSELSRGFFFLSAPDRDNLREMIVRPAELAGYAFEDAAIVDAMLAIATARGALPLLQFAATRLWDARDREKKLLTRKAYDAMGGVGGAFVRHADEVAAAVPPTSQRALRAIMTGLVTPEGTRAVIDHAELVSFDDGAARVLDQLVRGRLVHIHSDAHETATVEIVHEVLITAWPTLARWLDQASAIRGFVHELRQAARQWATRGKPADLVWRGKTAREALATADRSVLELAATERAFLAAVRAQVARRRLGKIAGLAAVIGILAAGAAGAALAFVKVSDAEREARAQAEAASTEAVRAHKAEAETAQQLVILQAEEARRAKAEAEAAHQTKAAHEQAAKLTQAEIERHKAETAATTAAAAETMSREDLEVTNAELESSLDASQRERKIMQTRIEQAQAATDAARASVIEAREELARARAELDALRRKQDLR
jgi:serine/threonine protein kinase